MAARGMPSHCRCGSGLLPKLRVCLFGRKGLRRSIAEHACLLKDLTDQGYTARTAHLTPVQIGILLSYWGMPDHVKDMTVKNPYLLVSKKYAK